MSVSNAPPPTGPDSGSQSNRPDTLKQEGKLGARKFSRTSSSSKLTDKVRERAGSIKTAPKKTSSEIKKPLSYIKEGDMNQGKVTKKARGFFNRSKVPEKVTAYPPGSDVEKPKHLTSADVNKVDEVHLLRTHQLADFAVGNGKFHRTMASTAVKRLHEFHESLSEKLNGEFQQRGMSRTFEHKIKHALTEIGTMRDSVPLKAEPQSILELKEIKAPATEQGLMRTLSDSRRSAEDKGAYVKDLQGSLQDQLDGAWAARGTEFKEDIQKAIDGCRDLAEAIDHSIKTLQDVGEKSGPDRAQWRRGKLALARETLRRALPGISIEGRSPVEVRALVMEKCFPEFTQACVDEGLGLDSPRQG